MRPERSVLEVDSTVEGVDVIMGVADGAMNKIASILTDMYKDPVLAPIRELSCNALDSHIAAGQDRPIEVSVGRQGSQLTLPVLRIQDWGLGLDEEDVKKIYSQYGASTKDQSDDFVGMLGIGSKSPLAYTDQFTVTAVKDGHRIVVAASRNDDASLVMTILDGGSTDEPNGVTVEVPVKPGTHDMLPKAERFFRFWERGTVLLNGEEPTPMEERPDAFHMTDSITVLDSVDDTTDFVVMGNVPYPTDFGFYQRHSGYNQPSGKIMVVRVGIGGVSFVPSREALMDSERTKKTLENIKREFQAAAIRAVQRDVDAASSHSEALTAFVKARDALPRDAQPDPSTLKFKGESLPEFPELMGSNQLANAGYKYSTGKRKPNLATLAEGIWVTGYDNDNFTGGQREKLKLYLIHELGQPDGYDTTKRPLFLTPDATFPHDKWVPKDLQFEWETVRKWKIPGNVQVGGYGIKVITGSYWTYRPDIAGTSEVAASDLPSDHLYWIRSGKYDGGNWWATIRKEDPKATLVLLSVNRIDKFKRDLPHAKNAKEAMGELVRARIKKLPADHRLAMNVYKPDEISRLKTVRNDLDDPALKRVVKLAVVAVNQRSTLRQIREDAQRWAVQLPAATDEPALETVRKRYPLIYAVSYAAPAEDLRLYANAAYAARKKEAN